MRVIREYKRAESLEEAWQLNQKKSNRVLGGMVWLKMGKMQIGTQAGTDNDIHGDFCPVYHTGIIYEWGVHLLWIKCPVQ